MRIYSKELNSLDYRVLKEGEAVSAGACLKMAEGGLVLCEATDKPEYISNTTKVGDGTVIPVDKVTPDATLAGELAANKADLEIGQKLSISADGTMVAVAAGALEVVGFDGTTEGARVLVVVAVS